MSFIITVDSGCNISDEFCKLNNICVIPFSICSGGNIYAENNPVLLNQALLSGSYTSHCPEISDYVDFWRRILSEGLPVLHISTGSSFSNAFSNASAARGILCSQNSGVELHIIDSMTAAGGCTLLLHNAVDMRASGLSASRCAAELEFIRHRIHGIILSKSPISMYKAGIIGFSDMLRFSLTGKDIAVSISCTGVDSVESASDMLARLSDCFGQSSDICISHCGPAVPYELYHHSESYNIPLSLSETFGTESTVLFFYGNVSDSFMLTPAKGSVFCPKSAARPAYL